MKKLILILIALMALSYTPQKSATNYTRNERRGMVSQARNHNLRIIRSDNFHKPKYQKQIRD